MVSRKQGCSLFGRQGQDDGVKGIRQGTGDLQTPGLSVADKGLDLLVPGDLQVAGQGPHRGVHAGDPDPGFGAGRRPWGGEAILGPPFDFGAEPLATGGEVLGSVVEGDCPEGCLHPPGGHAPAWSTGLVKEPDLAPPTGQASGAGQARKAGPDDGDAVQGLVHVHTLVP